MTQMEIDAAVARIKELEDEIKELENEVDQQDRKIFQLEHQLQEARNDAHVAEERLQAYYDEL